MQSRAWASNFASLQNNWSAMVRTVNSHFSTVKMSNSHYRPYSLNAPFKLAASSWKNPGVSELLPFTDDGGHYAHWNLQRIKKICVPIPKTQDNTFGFHAWLCSDIYCHPYGEVCALPNRVQATEFSKGGLQLNCRNLSKIINGTKMDPNSILWQTLWVLMLMWFFFFNKLEKNKVIGLCVEYWQKLTQFWDEAVTKCGKSKALNTFKMHKTSHLL